MNYYSYIVICDQLKRVDQLMKESSSTLTLLTSWSKSDDINPIGVMRGTISLSDFVSNLIMTMDKQMFHPVQEIARSEANRLSEILSSMMVADSDLINVLKKGMLQSIRTKLDKDTLLLMHIQEQSDLVGLYRRRLLDKALNLLIGQAVRRDRSRVSFILVIESINQKWAVSVGIGESLVVNPVGIGMTLTESQAKSRASAIFKGKTLLSTMYNLRTPSEREQFHPDNRRAASVWDKQQIVDPFKDPKS